MTIEIIEETTAAPVTSAVSWAAILERRARGDPPSP